ncbi:MFS transporter [Alkalicoccus chagannorensis]|uniref:MFS transporter n=1 Tax=Alkalicoccus chagannorensis TaxID=427072 RepID=UPI0004004002|nr:MFS transporter [Alkalicoccus chagannorensis]
MNAPVFRYWVLVGMVLIAGFSQGMLLPVLAVLLESAGVPSSMNGVNAAALYIGIILVSPFIEKPVRRWGYKPVILSGLILVTVSVLVIPLWQAFWFWFIMRMVVGIADNLIHFSTQVWISTTAPAAVRGRQLAVYGLAFGLGFGAGPMMTRLLDIHIMLPFLISALLSAAALILMTLVKNEFPDGGVETASGLNTWGRYRQVWTKAWFALLPGFCYGYLEASIHGSYPVYAMRMGIDLQLTTMLLLPGFVFGSLLTQLPLGMLSDRIGRSRVLIGLMASGGALFAFMPLAEAIPWLLFSGFLVTGMLLGSLFSLGIAYLADLVPTDLLPAGNVMTAVLFGFGSMLGPVMTGVLIEVIGSGAVYLSLSSVLFLMTAAGMFFHYSQHAPVDAITEQEPDRAGR